MFEAKTHFSALVEEVQHSGQIEITKRGKTVATLVRARQPLSPEEADRAVTRMEELRKGVTLGGLKIKDLINEGRKY